MGFEKFFRMKLSQSLNVSLGIVPIKVYQKFVDLLISECLNYEYISEKFASK